MTDAKARWRMLAYLLAVCAVSAAFTLGLVWLARGLP